MESKKYSVEIGGILYTIRTDLNEKLVKEASLFLQNQLTDLLEKPSRINEKDAIILIALKLATEYLRLNDEHAILQSKISTLLDKIEQEE